MAKKNGKKKETKSEVVTVTEEAPKRRGREANPEAAKRRVLAFLTPEQHDYLVKTAMPMSRVVREAVEAWIEKDKS